MIREDVKGSNRLKSFGKLVPFNYGCFPQTFRDPFEHDELHQAPGDNDPLDVIDVSLERLKASPEEQFWQDWQSLKPHPQPPKAEPAIACSTTMRRVQCLPTTRTAKHITCKRTRKALQDLNTE